MVSKDDSWKNIPKIELEKIIKESENIRQVALKIDNSDSTTSYKRMQRMIDFYNFDTSHFKIYGENSLDKANITENSLRNYISQSTSLAQVLNLYNLKPSGNNYKKIHELIIKYNIDTSHFLDLNGSSERKNNFDFSRFTKNSKSLSKNCRQALIFLRGHQCEICKLKEWQNQPIPLQIHHKDGDNTNNELQNLQLLCPNCHALTDNWTGKNINKNKKEVTKEELIEAIKNSKNATEALRKVGLKPNHANYFKIYNLLIEYKLNFINKLPC